MAIQKTVIKNQALHALVIAGHQFMSLFVKIGQRLFQLGFFLGSQRYQSVKGSEKLILNASTIALPGITGRLTDRVFHRLPANRPDLRLDKLMYR